MKPEGRAALLSGVGAIMGGWLGYALASSRSGGKIASWPAKPSAGTTVVTTVVGASLGAMLGAGIATHGTHDASATAAAISASQNNALQQTSGGHNVLVLDPSVTTQDVALAVGTPVIIYVPKGFTFVSVDGAPVTDTTSPYEFTFLGPITHTVVWNDSAHAQHTTTFNFSVAPTSTQSTTA